MKKYILIFFVLANNSIFAQINIQNSSNGGVTISPNGILANFPDSKKNDTTNISIGENALLNNPAGSKRHIAIGKNALRNYSYIPQVILDPDFSSQIAIGYGALTKHNPAIDGFNIAIGVKAMGNLTYHDGGNNISIGHLNMQNTNGRGVISIGNASLTSVSNSISSTSESIYIGNHINPLSANGVQNTVLGHYAFRNIGGDKNTILGFEAGYNVGSSSIGHGNVMVGFRAGKNETGSNKLYIENSDSSNTLIGGDFVTNRVGINRTTAQVSSTNRTFQVEGSALVTETLQLPFGSGTGKILTSDNLGNASWQNIPTNTGNWQTVGTNSARGGFNNNINDGNSNTILIGETNNSGAGQYMYGMGWGLELQGFGTSAVGMYNTIPTSSTNSFVGTDPLFIVGNGPSNAARSNALVIQKNGVVNIGISPNTSTSFRLRVGGSISSSSTIQSVQLRATNLAGSGDRDVCTDASGNLIVCTSTASDRIFNVSAMGFHPQLANGIAQTVFKRDINKTLASFTNNTKETEAFMFAPVELPQGFALNSMSFHFLQVENGEMNIRLVAVPKLANASASTLISIASTVGVGIQEIIKGPSTPLIIDNDNFYYSLILEAVSLWKGENMAIRGVVFNENKK